MIGNSHDRLGVPLIALCLFWLIGVVAGSAVLNNYVSTSGYQGKAVKKWLVSDSLALASPLSTLIMVVHPQCSCSQASITELAIIMARCHNKVKGYVLFVSPSNLPISWTKSNLWYRVKEMPGVSPIIDLNGSLAHQLNAETSGQTFVYDAHGDLSFSGGITSGRAHEGDNAGVDRVIACINGGATNSSSTAVFGCSLFSCSQVAPELQTSKANKQ